MAPGAEIATARRRYGQARGGQDGMRPWFVRGWEWVGTLEPK